MKLLTFPQLLIEKGIPYSRRHLRTLGKAGRFPMPLKLSTNGRIVWEEKKIDEWLRERGAVEEQPPQPLPRPPEPGSIGGLLRRQ